MGVQLGRDKLANYFNIAYNSVLANTVFASVRTRERASLAWPDAPLLAWDLVSLVS